MTRSEYEQARRRAAEMVEKAGILACDDELDGIEVADLGLGELDSIGMQIMTLVNTQVTGVKILILLPGQTFAEHKHPPMGDYPGKEETFRCQWGTLRLYVPGPPTAEPQGRPPAHRARYFTARHEIILHPGEQYTVMPNTWHWMQAGPEGALVWSFSPRATDAQDDFQDPEVVRQTIIVED
ncbi:MAG TPA: D-lyxose/D-mannose family sugar isomerase [Chloroflexi bacterium]|nr:D-lyxose/D-mannose family sugar isomerase [Chloroflexota bacterium]